jgi:hypothetical protein
MPADWKQHCPIDEDESPGEREAWRKGWAHRKNPDEETAPNGMDDPLLISVWLEGYSAADRHEQDR